MDAYTNIKIKSVRRLAGVSALLLTAVLLTGCAGNTGESRQSSQEPGSQQSSAMEEVRDYKGAEFIIGSHRAPQLFQEPGNSPEGDLIAQRFEEMEEKYHCKISYVTGSPEEFTTNFTTALASGAKYADVIDGNMYWWWGFQSAGYLEPLDDIQDLKIEDATWFPTYTEITKVDGKSYGVNWHTWYHVLPHAFHVMYFNQNILKEKNLESPYDLINRGEWNWENFREMVKKADDQQNGVYGLGSLGNHLEVGAIRSNGAREVVRDSDGRFVFGLTDERAYAALEFVREIIQTDKVYDPSCYDGRTATDFTVTIQNFCDGRYAFFAYHTDCLSFGGFLHDMDDDFGLVPFPKGPDGASDYNSAITGDTWVYAIPVTATDREMSGFLLRQLAQPLEGTGPNDWRSTAERNYFRDPEGAKQYFNIVENADSDYSWLTGTNNLSQYNAAVLQVTRDKAKTPAEAMEAIRSGFQTALDATLNKTE